MGSTLSPRHECKCQQSQRFTQGPKSRLSLLACRHGEPPDLSPATSTVPMPSLRGCLRHAPVHSLFDASSEQSPGLLPGGFDAFKSGPEANFGPPEGSRSWCKLNAGAPRC